MGITATIAAVAETVATVAASATAAVAAGVTAASFGVITGVGAEIVGGALIGAGLGAGEAAITGGDPGMGALAGGITGGAIPAGGALGAEIGVGATAGEIIGGAAGGALGAGATGRNPLTGALEGGAAGGLSAALSSSTGAADATGATVTTDVPGGVAPGSTIAPSAGGVVSPTGATDITAAQIGAQVAAPTAPTGAVAPSTDVGSLVGATPTAAQLDAPGGGDLLAPGTPGPTGGPVNLPTPDANLITGQAPGGIETGPLDTSGGVGGRGAFGQSGGTGTFFQPATPGSTTNSIEAAGANQANIDALTTATGSTPEVAGSQETMASVNAALGPAPADASTWDQINKFLNSPVTKLGAAAIPAAATLIGGQSQVPSSINPLLASGSVTGPLIGAEQTNLNAANAGQVTPGAAASIAQFQQQAEQALYQQLANEGVRDPRQDSRFIAGMQQIAQQTAILQQQFIQQEFSTGFAAAGEARGALTTAANAQVSQDNAFQSALASAMSAFGVAEGISSLKQQAAA